jgi:hypothetical protein
MHAGRGWIENGHGMLKLVISLLTTLVAAPPLLVNWISSTMLRRDEARTKTFVLPGNEALTDHVLKASRAGCLVNPPVGHEDAPGSAALASSMPL